MTTERRESGFVMLVLLTMLVPMLLVVGAFSVTMTGRTNELRVEMDEERALLAAEAGVDEAIFKGQTGALADGVNFQGTLGTDLSYQVAPTYLRTDGVDNDNDGLTDEADEDVFQVVVTGFSRNTERRLAAYLGPVTLLPPVTSAVGVQNPSPSIDLKGTPLISGFDLDMNGNPTGSSVPGLSIAPPGTVSDLEDELSGAEESVVVGAGGTPSLGTTAALDIPTLVAQLQNAANIVLTSKIYGSYNFGDGPAGIANITYREGDVKFTGNSQGAGILVVTGDLELSGTFRFDGVIIVLGEMKTSAGTTDVYGSVIQGPSGGLFQNKGTMNIHYSSQAIALANSGGGQYVSFNGWQELSR